MQRLPPAPDEPLAAGPDPDYLHTITEGRVLAHIRLMREGAPEPLPAGDWLLFLGTGGNPINLITQTRPTGGFLLRLGGSLVHFDPGLGALAQSVRAGVDLRNLDAVYVSHDHTDHAAEAGPVIEAMTYLMSRRRGQLLASPASLAPSGSISRFHQGHSHRHEGYPGGPARVAALAAGQTESVGPLAITPVAAYHGEDNFGCVVQGPGVSIGYTSDTGYIQTYAARDGSVRAVTYAALGDFEAVADYHADLRAAYAGVDVLVANVSYFNMFSNRQLTALGLVHLLSGARVRLCLLTHFDACYTQPTDVRAHLAAYVQARTGVPTVPAEEGLRVPLDALP